MLLPMIKQHDGFFLHNPRFCGCDVIILTKFYKNANISSTTNGKLTKSVSNFRKFNNPSNELSLKWKYRLVGTPWRVLIANGRKLPPCLESKYYSFDDMRKARNT